MDFIWDLFRKEAAEHQRVKWVEKALLISGMPTWIISVLPTLFVLIFLAFLVFSSYTRRINVYGENTTQFTGYLVNPY